MKSMTFKIIFNFTSTMITCKMQNYFKTENRCSFLPTLESFPVKTTKICGDSKNLSKTRKLQSSQKICHKLWAIIYSPTTGKSFAKILAVTKKDFKNDLSFHCENA